ncbi:MAG: hypothetical protein A4E24_01792 [Methanomethylovorans sp. PtaU1.Bin093]|nr:MAG: hypothetical protein A4E24_01792 [Methanomethylovorans sp. PtaU1.Bin093]
MPLVKRSSKVKGKANLPIGPVEKDKAGIRRIDFTSSLRYLKK